MVQCQSAMFNAFFELNESLKYANLPILGSTMYVKVTYFYNCNLCKKWVNNYIVIMGQVLIVPHNMHNVPNNVHNVPHNVQNMPQNVHNVP